MATTNMVLTWTFGQNDDKKCKDWLDVGKFVGAHKQTLHNIILWVNYANMTIDIFTGLYLLYPNSLSIII